MIVGILQARISSSRLPGKVLLPIVGKPMIELQIEREKRMRTIDRFIVATSTDQSDDTIDELCRKLHVDVYRGSLDDVLDRFYQAALPLQPDHVVRMTADCPLTDPSLNDDVVRYYLAGNYDYVSNALEPTFPDGLDIEVFSFKALEDAQRNATLPSHREHVTQYIHTNRQTYRVGNYASPTDLSSLRWTVDEKEDYEMVSRIYMHLYRENPAFGLQDILQLLAHEPELATLNTMHIRNAGLIKSLEKDRRAL